MDFCGTKLGDLGGENLTQNLIENEKPPASGIREVPGLEGWKNMELVKRNYGQDIPSPLAVGTLEVPCLEEMQSSFVVKSPEKRKYIPPGSWDIRGPMPGRHAARICSEKS